MPTINQLVKQGRKRAELNKTPLETKPQNLVLYSIKIDNKNQTQPEKIAGNWSTL